MLTYSGFCWELVENADISSCFLNKFSMTMVDKNFHQANIRNLEMTKSILGLRALPKESEAGKTYPDIKVHGANMGPTWVLSAPDGPHVVPMNLAIRVYNANSPFMGPSLKQMEQLLSNHCSHDNHNLKESSYMFCQSYLGVAQGKPLWSICVDCYILYHPLWMSIILASTSRF